MNVYMSSNDLNFIQKCIDEFRVNSDEEFNLYIDVKLDQVVKDYLLNIPSSLGEYITVYTPYVSNYVPNNFGFLFRFSSENWMENCEEFSKLEYYQGYPIEIDIDSFNDIEDEMFIDMLLGFSNKCGLYRMRDAFLNMTKTTSFEKYNTLVAFFAKELGVSLIWNHVGWIPDKPEKFGIIPESVSCNLNCLGNGAICEDGVYYCPYKLIKISDMMNYNSVTHRRELFKYFKEHRHEGCKCD